MCAALYDPYTSSRVIFVSSEWESRLFSLVVKTSEDIEINRINQVFSTLVFWYIQLAKITFITLAEVYIMLRQAPQAPTILSGLRVLSPTSLAPSLAIEVGVLTGLVRLMPLGTATKELIAFPFNSARISGSS